jgi:hypothetical protein
LHRSGGVFGQHVPGAGRVPATPPFCFVETQHRMDVSDAIKDRGSKTAETNATGSAVQRLIFAHHIAHTNATDLRQKKHI